MSFPGFAEGRLFGIKIMDVKPVLKQLPKIFDHKDRMVRAEGTALAVELYRWLGPAMKRSIEDLKPVQVYFQSYKMTNLKLKELNEEFEKLDGGKPCAQRMVRRDQAKQNSAALGETSNNFQEESTGDLANVSLIAESDAVEITKIDEFDLADPVAVLDQIPKNFYIDIASSKWKERKEALEQLLKVVNTPRLKDDRYHELLTALSKRIQDANVLVVIIAANCIDSIAKALRQNFTCYYSIVAKNLLERCKEKKQNVLDALRSALDSVSNCCSIDTIVEDVASGCVHKNPQVRSEAIQWYVRSLKVSRKQPGKAEFKSASAAFVKALEDCDILVREASAEALGTLMKVFGERLLTPFLVNLDAIKVGKVREYFEGAQVSISGNVSGTAARKTAAGSASASNKNVISKASEKENTPPASLSGVKTSLSGTKATKPLTKTSANPLTKAASNRNSSSEQVICVFKLLSQNAASSKTAAAAPNTKKSKNSAAEVQHDRPMQFKFTNDSATQVCTEFFGSGTIEGLADSAWKARLASVNSIHDKLSQAKDEIEAEAVCRLLMVKPGWKESNFQVSTVMINCFSALARNSSSFDRACVSLLAGGLADKLGDIKVKKVAGECLGFLAEATSLGLVLSQGKFYN